MKGGCQVNVKLALSGSQHHVSRRRSTGGTRNNPSFWNGGYLGLECVLTKRMKCGGVEEVPGIQGWM